MRNYNNFVKILSGIRPLYAKGWTASKATNIKLNVLATFMTWLPFPFPSLAPLIIPGKYNNCD